MNRIVGTSVGGNGRMNANGNRNKGRERDERPANPQIRQLPYRATEVDEIEHLIHLFDTNLDGVEDYAAHLRQVGWSMEKVYNLITQASFAHRKGRGIVGANATERAQAKAA